MNIQDLASIPLFAGVSPDLLKVILPQLSKETFLQGQRLFDRGSSAGEFFIILHGSACIERDESFLVTRGEYEIVGEQALLADGFRSAAATAQGLVSALRVPKAALDLLLGDPCFGRNLACGLSTKLTQATRDRGFRYSKEALVFGEFRAHVAPEVLNRLIADGADYGAPRKTNVVVLFSDIRDFTRWSSEMEPDDLALDLTTYLNHVVDVVHKHGGMVDKFVGDAVMAVWGGFEELHAEHARQAFDCAKCMVASATEFTLGSKPIQIGVGLNAGNVFIGNIGGSGKRQFTVLGSAVNLAARFEAETKNLSQPIVLGEGVVRLLGPAIRETLSEHAGVLIKGASPQRLYSFDPAATVLLKGDA